MTIWLARVVGSMVLLAVSLSVAWAQTPIPNDPRDEWWTAWSACEITPVQTGSAPDGFSGKPDELYWLSAETTNDSSIEMIVWLWTGNRPLPLDGVYAADKMSTKWLWAFSEPVTEISAVVTSDSGATGEVQFGAQTTAVAYRWPSFAVVPEAGCWTFEIAATTVDGSVYEGRVVFPAVP